jgi:hypothetical protein
MKKIVSLSVWGFAFLLMLAAGSAAASLGKFAPDHGCYLGAFIELDYNVQGDIGNFESLTKKKHASYFTYVGYGRPFPKAWVEKLKAHGAVPQIAFEPNNGLDEVKDDDYLRDWARDAARARVPIFLRWASEMNGPWTAWSKDPAQYIEKFKLVAQVMREEAPNVAMVWCPFAEPQRTIMDYYPGDEWVDWVGVNIYSVYVNDGDPTRPAFEKDPAEMLRYVYDKFPNKPIMVCEYAATIESKGGGLSTVEFAIDKMTRMYDALKTDFPRVGAIYWFSWDTIRGKKANNNYSFLADGRTLLTYRELTSDPYFLSRVPYNPNQFPLNVKPGTTLGAGGTTLRGKSSIQENLDDSAALLMGLQNPLLQGIQDGDVVGKDLNLRVLIPEGWQINGIAWQVDGQSVALTNNPPYRISVSSSRFAPGMHTARVVVYLKDWSAKISPDVAFQVPKGE